MMNRNILCVVLAFGLANCASILSGTTQEVVVNTNPPGADCVLNRLDESIGSVNPTPGGVTIQKTKEDITIVCNLEGYQEATHLSNSGIQASTWGNIVLGGPVGWAVDSARGADNYYDTPVNITLVPAGQTALPPESESESDPASELASDVAPGS